MAKRESNRESNKPSTENPKPQQTQNSSSEKPNPNVKPPRFHRVTEGYNPKRTGKILNERKDK